MPHTILVVDDEVVVRNFVATDLQIAGYSVLAAADGKEAQELMREYDGRIDLVVTDMRMPRIGGLELVESLARELPSVRVLTMSGRDSDQTAAAHTHLPFLLKPCDSATLRAKVREVLESEAQRSAR
jgi:two-component system cell cycle sensor histidine kinase/response regulator CckA